MLFPLKSFLLEILPYLGILAAIYLYSHYSSKKRRLLRGLKKAKAIPIHKIQENKYSKIVGKAKYVKEPLTAPLTGRPCVFFQVIVEQQDGRDSWTTVIDQTRTVDFFIEKGGEMAIVKLEQAGSNKLVILDKDRIMESGPLKNANEQLESYLKGFGKKSTNLFGWNKTLRYKEGIIEPDEEIVVTGVAEWKTLKEPIAGYNYSKVLTLNGTIDHKLLVSDLEIAVSESKKVVKD